MYTYILFIYIICIQFLLFIEFHFAFIYVFTNSITSLKAKKYLELFKSNRPVLKFYFDKISTSFQDGSEYKNEIVFFYYANLRS